MHGGRELVVRERPFGIGGIGINEKARFKIVLVFVVGIDVGSARIVEVEIGNAILPARCRNGFDVLDYLAIGGSKEGKVIGDLGGSSGAGVDIVRGEYGSQPIGQNQFGGIDGIGSDPCAVFIGGDEYIFAESCVDIADSRFY